MLPLYVWNIGCSLYIEEISAEVRGDNMLQSHTTNDSRLFVYRPFFRPEPSHPLEMAWTTLVDTISGTPWWPGPLPTRWLENQLQDVFNLTGATNDKLTLLEARLQNITSMAYALCIDHLRMEDANTGINGKFQYTPIPDIQKPAASACLRINGIPVLVGLVCVAAMAVCVIVAAGVSATTESSDYAAIVATGIRSTIAPMRGVDLPALTVQGNATEGAKSLTAV